MTAADTITRAVQEHQPSKVYALFSGGHDSLTATHLASRHPAFTGVAHINTGIGIEETREFVRETCRTHGWPLIELHPDAKTYDQLVQERGFPRGPRSHNTMYYWLKQRQLRRLVRDAKTHPKDRVGLVTGVRAVESTRRMASAMAVPIRRNGAQVWINPILDWTAKNCNDYITEHGLTRTTVADLLHRSGECLCGALAHAREIVEIEQWYPEAASRLHALEASVADRHPLACVWARWELPPVFTHQGTFDLPLCVSCEGRAA